MFFVVTLLASNNIFPCQNSRRLPFYDYLRKNLRIFELYHTPLRNNKIYI